MDKTGRLVVSLDGEDVFVQDGVTNIYGGVNGDGEIRIRAACPPRERRDIDAPTTTVFDGALAAILQAPWFEDEVLDPND